MKEDLIQFLWRSKALLDKPLCLTNGKAIEVLHPGHLNVDQGPDFLFAKIKVEDLIWHGHIEIHLKSSDWKLHFHDEDPNYQNIILHVVWEHDQEVYFKDRRLPCLELKNYTASQLLDHYLDLMRSKGPIPCSAFINEIPESIRTFQIERMMVERLEEKTMRMQNDLENSQWDWESIFYKTLAHYLVAPVNSDAMDQLTFKIDRSLYLKCSSELETLQALFFGMAGMLNEALTESYSQTLYQVFSHQKNKFDLEPMQSFEWKLLRLRPAHFPALRIAQLTALLYQWPHLFSTILEAQDLKSIYIMLEVDPGSFWLNHAQFNKFSRTRKLARIGPQTKDILIINAIIPLLFAYGFVQQKTDYCQKAMSWLQLVKTEKNNIVYMWKSFNFAMNHAGHSQGGIQLYHSYCCRKRCSMCQIGNEILNRPMNHVQPSV